MDATPTRQCRIALAGPCGAGKSTLASLLVATSYGVAVVHEPPAPWDMHVAGIPPSSRLEHFQCLISTYRRHHAMFNSGARVLLFDRTLEEDREIFLQMYHRLGCIDAAQLDRLTRFSIEAERSIGAPDGTIVLTATPEILQSRLEHAKEQRPQWLVKHIGLQHELYNEWIAKKRETALVLDTSTSDSASLSVMAKKYVDTVMVGNSPHR